MLASSPALANDGTGLTTPTAASLSLPPPMPVVSGKPNPWLNVWIGFGWVSDSLGLGASAITALNHDIWADGVLLRADLAGSRYDYTGGAYTNIDVDGFTGDVMLGWQKNIGKSRFNIFIGPQFRTDDNPDAGATVRGDKWGVKVIGEYDAPVTPKLTLSGMGVYSSIYNEYFAQIGSRYQFTPQFRAGPQIGFAGGDTYQVMRAGVGLAYDTRFDNEIAGEVGYAWKTSGTGSSGVFVGVSFSQNFR